MIRCKCATCSNREMLRKDYAGQHSNTKNMTLDIARYNMKERCKL